MSKIGIVTDSTAYLEEDYIKEHDIKVVPLKVILEEKSYREGVDLTNDDFYRRLEEPGVFPTTSQPSAGEFLEAYREMADSHDSLFSIHISAGISGTVESARTAAADMGDYPIDIIDSRFTGIQLTLIIDRVVKARDEGAGREDLINLAEKTIKGSELMFMVATLEYLHRGGRIGGAQALMGSMLRIKPILYIDGTIDALEKVRGEGKALDRLLELAVERTAGKQVRIGFTHVRAENKMRELKARAEKALNCDPADTLFNETGPVIGSHVGPGTVGIAYYTLD